MEKTPPPCLYRCLKCQRSFFRPHPGPTSCAHCGHVYVQWLNYEEVIAARAAIGEDKLMLE